MLVRTRDDILPRIEVRPLVLDPIFFALQMVFVSTTRIFARLQQFVVGNEMGPAPQSRYHLRRANTGSIDVLL